MAEYTHPLNIYVTPQQYEELRRLAFEQRVTIGSLVREAVYHRLSDRRCAWPGTLPNPAQSVPSTEATSDTEDAT